MEKRNWEPWISSLDQYFKENNYPERLEAVMAMSCLSDDVRACLQSLHTPLEAISGKEWIWTWAELKVALRAMSSQIAHYEAQAERNRRGNILRGVATVGTGLLVGAALPFAGSVVVLPALTIAFCTSVAAKRAELTAGTAKTSVNASSEAWHRIDKETPSHSWKDGSKFKPSRALITALLELA